MSYAIDIPGEPQLLELTKIHKSASDTARQAYLDAYGVDYHDDPLWVIGGERHQLWLDAFTARQAALILQPNQA